MADPREDYGRLVRDTFVAWANEQPDPKPSWLVPWDELEPDNEVDAGQREVDMRIGEAVAAAERERITGRFNEWIEILMAEPNAWPPDAWKAAFASLVDPDYPGKIAGPKEATDA